MNKKYIIAAAFLILGAVNQSCSNDFIEVSPTESIPESNVDIYNSNEGASSFVTSIYAKFLDWNMSTFAWIGVTSIVSDDADKGSSPGDTGSDKDILDALNFTPSTRLSRNFLLLIIKELTGQIRH